jgi:uncharacterized protein YllA (UPF0747 family)
VCQDAFFGTHTYIAGPGEVKYIKELDPIYEFHGIRKAEVIPRMSITLLEPRALRILKKQNLSLQDVFALEKPKFVKKVLKERTGFDYKELTQTARQLTQEYLETLKGLGVDIRKTQKYLHQAIKENLGEQRSQEKAKLESSLKSASLLSDLLMPFGKRQERVFNIFYYMNLYGGLRFIDWLYERYDPSLETLEL